ncbi:MAG: hypothetical protein ACRDQX_10245 [Pseudonocardiaceae bacterium]
MITANDVSPAARALLLRVGAGELLLQRKGLAWSDGNAVSAEENELLRHLWWNRYIDVLGIQVGQPVGLTLDGHRVVAELLVFGALSESRKEGLPCAS